VTDKVNEPELFASKFIDKSRLMMELFSMESVRAALDVGIKSAIANWALVKHKDVDEIVRLGITAIAASCRSI
jgi:hypothetical protein